MQSSVDVCVITSNMHSQSKNGKIKFLKFPTIYVIVSVHEIHLTNCIHKLCEPIAKLFCKIGLF